MTEIVLNFCINILLLYSLVRFCNYNNNNNNNSENRQPEIDDLGVLFGGI